jgi:uncharacterized membrane protein YhaH (DUF805 family)
VWRGFATGGAMIRDTFSFKGTVGRLGFLVRVLAVGLATFVALAILGVASVVLDQVVWGGRPPDPYKTGVALLICASTMVPYLWGLLALTAKRLRSIGLQPAAFIVLSIALGFIEGGLLMPAFRHRELFGFYGLLALRVWDVLFALVLFLWPQKTSLDRRTTIEAAFA